MGGEIPSEARYVPREYQNGIFSIVSCVYGFFICLSFDVKAKLTRKSPADCLRGQD